MKEKKIYIYIYMRASAYNVISKEVENRVFRKNRIFRHKYYQSFMTIQEQNTELEKNVHRKYCTRDISFLAANPTSYIIFCHFLRLFSYPPTVCTTVDIYIYIYIYR